MSDTDKIDISVTEWTEIASNSGGWVSNESDNVILLRKSQIKPGSNITVGHKINPMGAGIRFEVAGEFKIYARALKAQLSINKSPFVVVTIDLGLASFGENELKILNKAITEIKCLNREILSQLKLLNIRTEEMGDTGLNLEDIGE